MADFSNIHIDNEQARKFAKVIHTDVIEYIKTHKDELTKDKN